MEQDESYEWSPTAEWNLTPGVTTDLEALHHKFTDCRVIFNMMHADMTRTLSRNDVINMFEMLGLMEQVAAMTFRYIKDGGKTRKDFYKDYDEFRKKISHIMQIFRFGKKTQLQVNVNEILEEFAIYTRWFYDTVIKTGIWLKQSNSSGLDGISDFD